MDAELANDIGQMLIVGFTGLEPTAGIKELIEKYRVGTIILFARNAKDPQQLLDLTRSLQQIAKDAGHEQPLLISIDQENGLVSRIPGSAVPSFPGAMTLGAGGDLDCVREVYSKAAKYLRFYGIQANYAPVADINSNPKNPVINIRSYGDTPTKVAEFIVQGSKGSMEHNVLPCIKHFPGHGDTAIDSHYGTAIVEKSMEEMEKCELVPFVHGVKENVESIMMAHIVVPSMGDDLPASISPSHYNYLKNKLGYDGYIVTDCLEMESISKTVGTEKGAELAVVAGADAVMICHLHSRQVGGFEHMYAAVQDGKISRESIKKSVKKLRDLKKDLVQWDEVLAKKTPESLSAAEVAKDEADMAKVFEKCSTLVRGTPDQYLIKSGEKVAFVYVGVTDASFQSGVVQDPAKSFIKAEYSEVLKQHDITVETISFDPDTVLSSHDDVIKSCDRIILATLNATRNPSQQALAHHLSTLGKPLTVIATFSPYDFLEDKYSDEFPVYIPTFEPSVASFRAAVKLLFGEITPKGVLPIKKG